MVNLLVAAAISAAMPAPVATAVQPALFEVQDADTTIYLFGTFHALDGDTRWLNPAIGAALASSDELVLETLLPEPGAPPIFVKAAFTPPSMTPSGSFLATTRMALNAGRSQGMQVDNGADMVLRRVAEAEGKRVEGLETLELQINMFNQLRLAAPAKAESAAARPMDNLSQTMTKMQAAWKRGDQSVFVSMLDQLRNGSPETYRTMFMERNARWADWVAARMRSPGVVFVAVGAGHLAGKDSLLVRLAEKGVESQRVE